MTTRDFTCIRFPLALSVFLIAGSALGQDNEDVSAPQPPGLSVGFYPARQLEEGAQLPRAWQAVAFPRGDSQRQYGVGPEPIFTERNIASVKSDEGQSDFLQVLLDETGRKAMSDYTGNPAHRGQPIGIKIGDRWAAFPVVQAHIRDGRAVLPNLTASEIQALLAAYPADAEPPAERSPGVQAATARRFFTAVLGVIGLGILASLIPLARRRDRLGGVLLSPASTLQEVAGQPEWVGPFFLLLVSALIGALAGIGMFLKMLAGASGLPFATMIVMAAMSLLTVLIAAFASWFIRTGGIWLLARLSGAKTRFYPLLSVTGYAFLPELLAAVLMFFVLIFGQAQFPSLSPAMPTSLAGLFPDLVKGSGPPGLANTPLAVLLTRIELFALWSLALTAVGLQRVYGFSMRKAGILSALYWILAVSATVGFAVLMNAFQQMAMRG